MIDLRLFKKDLLGKSIKPRKCMTGHDECEIIKLTRDYTINKIYPFHVMAYTVCENGCIFRECFSVGDLIQLSLINTVRLGFKTEKKI